MSTFDLELSSTEHFDYIVAVVLKLLGTHNIVWGIGRIVIIGCYEHRTIMPFRQVCTLILNTSLLKT